MVHFQEEDDITQGYTCETCAVKTVHLGAIKRIAFNMQQATEAMFDWEPLSIAL